MTKQIRIRDNSGLYLAGEQWVPAIQLADVFEDSDDCPCYIVSASGVSLEKFVDNNDTVLYYEEEDDDGNGSLEVMATGYDY